jgi:putative endonuclease
MTSDTLWVLYVLQCSDGTFYTGITNDISKRLVAHNSGRGAKYTRSRLPCELIAKSSLYSRSICAKAEYKFKKISRQKKEFFVSKGIDTFVTSFVLPLLPE